MEDILLAVTVIAFSVFGLYMASHLDRFIDRICLSFQRPQEPEGRICITGTKEKSIETIDPRIIEYLEEAGFNVRFEP
ncbi:MAG: hypothetical protein IJ930_00760 [Lachnospiraceae bacterium]|nr:hypothetical protein [Lachnospiraceae bacterium]